MCQYKSTSSLASVVPSLPISPPVSYPTMSHSFNGTYATAPKASIADVSRDVELNNPAEDSISSLTWSSAGNYLATSSWGKKVRIYNLSNLPSGEPMALMEFDAPVLSCDWSPVKHHCQQNELLQADKT